MYARFQPKAGLLSAFISPSPEENSARFTFSRGWAQLAKFIAMFSHFISCGTYEGLFILDGLMTNESDIRPDTIHGDT